MNSARVSLCVGETWFLNLIGGSSNNAFTVPGWRGGGGTINGSTGRADQIITVRDTDMTLTNASLAAADFGTLTLADVETANLSGGTAANKLTANQSRWARCPCKATGKTTS